MEIEMLIQRHLEGKTVYPAFLEEPAKGERPSRYYIVARVGVSPYRRTELRTLARRGNGAEPCGIRRNAVPPRAFRRDCGGARE